MELFASLSFWGGALVGGLILLLYRTLSVNPKLSYRHLIALLSAGIWLAILGTRPYQPLALLLISGSAIWAVRRQYIPTWLAVLITMAPLLMLKTGVSSIGAMLGLSFATFRAIDVLLFAQRNERISPVEWRSAWVCCSALPCRSTSVIHWRP